MHQMALRDEVFNRHQAYHYYSNRRRQRPSTKSHQTLKEKIQVTRSGSQKKKATTITVTSSATTSTESKRRVVQVEIPKEPDYDDELRTSEEKNELPRRLAQAYNNLMDNIKRW